METKYCKACKKDLPIKMFECHANCRKCYKKDYYQRNKKKIKEKTKNYQASISLRKKQEGSYRWNGTLEDEKNKFNFFLNQHGIKKEDLSDL